MTEVKTPARGRRRRATKDAPTQTSTRERILDIALDLFIEKGFDKSSLREIAEHLGFSKAAIYYHFASKDEILMALHRRLHEIGDQAIEQLRQLPAGVDSWAALLNELVGEMLAHRKIFVMHDRNRSAFEQLRRREHQAKHEDLDDELRRVISDPSLPLSDRVRMGCAVGAVVTTLVVYGDLLRDVPSDELEGLLRDVVNDLLGRRVRGRWSEARRSGAIGTRQGRPSSSAGQRARPRRRSPP